MFYIAENGNGFSDAYGHTATMQPGSTLGRAEVGCFSGVGGRGVGGLV